MRVGLFGGTFDPVHEGHVATARQVRANLALDELHFVVTGRPPHKERCLAPAWRRFVMVELALLSEAGLFASAAELDASRPSYTIETLEAWRSERPDDELFLVVGADALAGLHGWRRGVEIPDVATVVAMVRPGWSRETVVGNLPESIVAAMDRGRVHWAEIDPVDASSTRVRAELGSGGRPAALARPVVDYARKYDLYR